MLDTIYIDTKSKDLQMVQSFAAKFPDVNTHSMLPCLRHLAKQVKGCSLCLQSCISVETGIEIEIPTFWFSFTACDSTNISSTEGS